MKKPVKPFEPEINGGHTTVPNILNDGWKPTSQRIKFLSPDGKKVLYFNPKSGTCTVEETVKLKIKKGVRPRRF